MTVLMSSSTDCTSHGFTTTAMMSPAWAASWLLLVRRTPVPANASSDCCERSATVMSAAPNMVVCNSPFTRLPPIAPAPMIEIFIPKKTFSKNNSSLALSPDANVSAAKLQNNSKTAKSISCYFEKPLKIIQNVAPLSLQEDTSHICSLFTLHCSLHFSMQPSPLLA